LRGAPCHGTIGTMVNPALDSSTPSMLQVIFIGLHAPSLQSAGIGESQPSFKNE
jgi:hypothetical protein